MESGSRHVDGRQALAHRMASPVSVLIHRPRPEFVSHRPLVRVCVHLPRHRSPLMRSHDLFREECAHWMTKPVFARRLLLRRQNLSTFPHRKSYCPHHRTRFGNQLGPSKQASGRHRRRSLHLVPKPAFWQQRPMPEFCHHRRRPWAFDSQTSPLVPLPT